MTRKKLLILILFLLPFFLVIAGIIGAIIRLINIQNLVIMSLLIFCFIKYSRSKIFKLLLNKFIFKSNKSKRLSSIPRTKKDAAKQSLFSIDQLMKQIENKVALEGLRLERQRVEEELSRGDIEVVVFGTGSSGKTSLIRSLLNQIVGNTGPMMGSTTKSISYRLCLKGLERGIKIIDTPGILESGNIGRLREKEALIQATRSDLMIVVIDSDLRDTEFKIIKSLSEVGKKLFLVLNKIDLRGIDEEERLLAILRNRVKSFINADDVIPVSASPQTIPKIGGNPYQPSPEIEKLVKRLAIVLHEEGDELLADNILLQCKNLGNIGRDILNNQREIKAKFKINRYGWISSGVVFFTPLPGIDLLATAAVNTQMVIEIGRIYGIEITKERAKELAISVGKTITSLGLVQGGISAIGTILKLNLPTVLVGKFIQSITAAWLTRIAGESFIYFFQKDQDWGDGGIQEVVQKKYKLNKRERHLNKFIKQAFERVIDPLIKNDFKKLPPNPMRQERDES